MIDPLSRRTALGAKSAFMAVAFMGPALSLSIALIDGAAVAAMTANAEDFASPPSRAAASSTRLLSGGPAANGFYSAGVEIDLEPGTITYWRSPGEAGAPPIFDFSASTNVSAVEVVYPAPKRIDEHGIVVAGYDSRVIFPLKVAPRDPKAPVSLNLSLRYSACGKICLPAHAVMTLALPQTGVSPHAADIAAEARRAPRRLDPAQAAQAIALDKPASERWRLVWRGQGKAEAVFIEVADPLFVESSAGDGAFDLKLYLNGATPAPVVATATILTDGEAYEAPVTLR